MAEPIVIEIEVDSEDAQRALRAARGDVEDFSRGAEEGARGAEDLDVGMRKAAAGAAAAGVAIGATVAALVNLGREFERQISILNRFNGDISEASRRLNGAVSDLDLMVAQTRLANAGLELTAEEFANLAVAANEMAASTGEDSVQALQQLGQAIITGGEELIRYGVDLEGVTDRAGKQRAALEQLGEAYGGVESSADSLGGRFDELVTLAENYTTAIIDDIGASTQLELAMERLGRAFGLTGGRIEDTLISVEDFAMGVTAVVTNLVERIDSLVRAIQQLSTADLEGARREINAFVDNTLDDTARRVGIETGARRAQEQRERELREMRIQKQREMAAQDAGERGPRGRGRGRVRQEEDPEAVAAAEAAAALEAEMQLLEALKIKRDEVAQAELENQQRIREARWETQDAIRDQQERSDQAYRDILERQREQERQMEEARIAAMERVASEEQRLAQERLATAKQVTGGVIQGGDQLLEAFGATQGQMELWRGISDAAQAVTSFASQNYVSGALYLLSSGLHFKNAAEMGVGGGSANAAAGGVAGTTERTARPEPSSGSGGGGGVVNNTINFNIPVPESQVGRMQRRADRTAQRRFG